MRPRRKQVQELTAKGFAGTVFLTTEDCQASYDEMTARGVEFTEEPHIRCRTASTADSAIRRETVCD